MKDEYYKKIIDALIELVDEGVYIVDQDGVGIHYNKPMSDMEKISVKDVIGRKFNEVFPEFSMDESTMFKALKKNKPTLKQEQTYKNLYGQEITTINSTIPITIDGKPVAAVEVAKNITSIRKMSDTLLELQEEAVSPIKQTKSGIKKYTFDNLIGENIQFKEVVGKAKKAAQVDASVFICGETGTGKELLAQSIHYEGVRKDKPFLAQNCAAIPESLLEGILFGTSKGAFTGAVDRAGLFEQASGGTLLLDELSAMPYSIQSKLLRVLQESYIRRVGGNKDIPVDVRIIATVNESPTNLIDEGKLRRDLYYRLNIINLTIPPLRERMDDIPILVDYFMKKHNKRFNKSLKTASEGALKRLKNYSYPGNVRELENIIEQAVSMADKETLLTGKQLSMPNNSRKIRNEDLEIYNRQALNEYMEEVEKRIIKNVILETDGNITHAADRLQIKRQTLQHKMKKYHI